MRVAVVRLAAVGRLGFAFSCMPQCELSSLRRSLVSLFGGLLAFSLVCCHCCVCFLAGDAVVAAGSRRFSLPCCCCCHSHRCSCCSDCRIRCGYLLLSLVDCDRPLRLQLRRMSEAACLSSRLGSRIRRGSSLVGRAGEI